MIISQVVKQPIVVGQHKQTIIVNTVPIIKPIYEKTAIIQSSTPATFTHLQIIPSTTWNINHLLGRYPSIQLFSAGGVEFFGDVQHVSINQSIITLTSNVAGIAQCN